MTPEKKSTLTHRKIPNNFQFIYGIALILVGLGVFYRIPQVMEKIQSFKQFSAAIWVVRFCFYFMGIVLIGGGLKKIWGVFKESNGEDRKER
jgi:hypothetical protein